jgi:hypothetical protein
MRPLPRLASSFIARSSKLGERLTAIADTSNGRQSGRAFFAAIR